MSEPKVDVFISGAGPVGLLLAYQFRQQGISTFIVDKDDKADPNYPLYGRACSLWPRTLEMMDQMELFDDLAQMGIVSDQTVTFQSGKRVQGRGWDSWVSGLSNTYFGFALNLRLKFMEDLFREKLAKLGCKVHAPMTVVDFHLDSDTSPDSYPVTVECEDGKGVKHTIKSKYIIAADGGHSTIRKKANIHLKGDSTSEHWIRLDAKVKTNMPEERKGFAAIETKDYGQVLWVAVDHGVTRIGYALTPELYEKYGPSMTAEQAMTEAKNALAPFTLEFERLDWYTVYTISQRVAEKLSDRGRIFLTGDAAHTHSSGGAQGMNTGVHDAVTLAWRITGVLKGWYKPAVLETYGPERHRAASKLIEIDKTLSKLESGHDPEKGSVIADQNLVWKKLRTFMDESKDFSTGLGVDYESNLLNAAEPPVPLLVKTGHRAPDVKIRKPGPYFESRLYELTRNNAKFKVIVFFGERADHKKNIRAMAEKAGLAASGSAFDMITIIAGYGTLPSEHVGFECFGTAVWDVDHTAHGRYGISTELGAIAVIRPDGILGFSTSLDGFEGVKGYLSGIFLK